MMTRLLSVGALTAAAAYAFSPLFAGSRDVPVLLASAAVPFALAALTTAPAQAPVMRVPAGLRAPLGLAGGSLVAVLATRPGIAVVDGPFACSPAPCPSTPPDRSWLRRPWWRASPPPLARNSPCGHASRCGPRPRRCCA